MTALKTGTSNELSKSIKKMLCLSKLIFLFLGISQLSFAQQMEEGPGNFEAGASSFSVKESLGIENMMLSEQILQSAEPGQEYLLQARKAYLSGSYSEALPYALQALSKFEKSNNADAKEAAFQLLSGIYYQEKAYDQALFYDLQLEKLLTISPTKLDQLAALRFSISQHYIEAGNFEQASFYAKKTLVDYKQLQSTSRLKEIYETLLFIAQQREQYEDALVYAQWLQQAYARQKNYSQEVVALNNLGFIYQRTGEKRKALESFKQAIAQSKKVSEEFPVVLLINLGLAYSNLGNDKQALQYYEEVLKIQRIDENRVGEAEISNYIASHYYLSGRQSNALKIALEASQIALEEREWDILLDSYRLLRLIYQKEKRDAKAQEYENKFLEIQAYLEEQSQTKKKELEQIQKSAVVQEEKMRAFWNDKEQDALTQERKETRLKLQEQELSLLKKETELKSLALSKHVLEGNNAKQALAIANQQLQAEQQERQLEALARAKEIQTLKINRQKLEQDKQRQTIDLLETDRQLKEGRLLQEATLRKYGYGILGLCVSIMGVIAFSSIQRSKDNKRLKKQKKEILEKNDLLQLNEQNLTKNMLHLEKTQAQLAEQKAKLTLSHNRVQESIAYAKQIQKSILPSEEYIKQLFPESFLIFMPKDIVSGDFYWISEHGDYQILIVADCTGHGVPGALITLIGHSLLTEAIQAHQMDDPGAILTFLHQKLLERFRYHESSRQHGMDVGICVIRREGQKHKLHYAGAKNTLWVIKDGKFSKLKGNRISLGSARQAVSFDTQQVQLGVGDKIYLSSDGFIDQPDMERNRFGSAQLTSCLRAWERLPMNDQKKYLLAAFADHQQGAEQRDDISLIGVSF